MDFPYGKAALFVLIGSLFSALLLTTLDHSPRDALDNIAIVHGRIAYGLTLKK